MAFDEALADRIRELVAAEPDLTERQMFGGLAFLVGGHMAVAAGHDGGLMVRTDPQRAEQLLATTAAAPMEMGGRTMKGWLRVAAADLRTTRQLTTWLTIGLDFVHTLPPKGRR